MSMERLQEELKAHDAKNWKHAPGFATERHNAMHVGITSGKIDMHVEAMDDGKLSKSDQLDPMLVADLVIEAMRFATNGSFDIETAVAKRLQEISERVTNPDS